MKFLNKLAGTCLQFIGLNIPNRKSVIPYYIIDEINQKQETVMNKRQWKRGTVVKLNPLTNFTVRVLSVGNIELNANQWSVPKSTSLFWSIYIPDSEGLELGPGKSATKVPAESIALVPPGASAARDNTTDMTTLFLHFDIGGFVGIKLQDQLKKIAVVSAAKFQSQIAEIDEAIDSHVELRLQLCAQELLAGVLADCVANCKTTGTSRSSNQEDLQQILPAIYAIEERLSAPIYHSLKINEMAGICGLKPTDFSRIFFESTGRNPAEYSQDRRITIAVQQLLFTNKSIDEISSSLTFANRFYFSRVFKDAVGDTPAAYRAIFRAQE